MMSYQCAYYLFITKKNIRPEIEAGLPRRTSNLNHKRYKRWLLEHYCCIKITKSSQTICVMEIILTQGIMKPKLLVSNSTQLASPIHFLLVSNHFPRLISSCLGHGSLWTMMSLFCSVRCLIRHQKLNLGRRPCNPTDYLVQRHQENVWKK